MIEAGNVGAALSEDNNGHSRTDGSNAEHACPLTNAGAFVIATETTELDETERSRHPAGGTAPLRQIR
jgi:hypothetical protein